MLSLYEVVYEVFFMKTNKNIRLTTVFFSLCNAEYTASRISAANDVIGDVNIIDDLTGEIISTYSKGERIYNRFESEIDESE